MWREPAFLGEDLIDEFHLFTHPVVLGGGTPLFSPLEGRRPVRLVEARTCEPGVVLLGTSGSGSGRPMSPGPRRRQNRR